MRHILARVLRISLALSIAALVLSPAAPSTAAQTCEPPEPKLNYRSDVVVVTLDLDLRGCRWWKGDSIDLFGEMYGDPVGPGTGAFTTCAYAIVYIEDKRGRLKKADTQPPVMRHCRIKLRLEHSPLEVSRYVGSFEYPWRGGPVTHDFEFLCISSPVMTECRE